MRFFRKPEQPARFNTLDPDEQQRLDELLTQGTEGIRASDGTWHSGLNTQETTEFGDLWRRAGGGEIQRSG